MITSSQIEHQIHNVLWELCVPWTRQLDDLGFLCGKSDCMHTVCLGTFKP